MQLTHLILDVLFPPLRGDVSGEMLGELHPDSRLLLPLLLLLQEPGLLGACSCFTNVYTQTVIRRSPPGCGQRQRQRCPFVFALTELATGDHLYRVRHTRRRADGIIYELARGRADVGSICRTTGDEAESSGASS